MPRTNRSRICQRPTSLFDWWKPGVLDLDEDVLQEIMRFLDGRERRTARLVCKNFCQSASAHLKGLHISLAELTKASSTALTQLSRLTRLEVSVSDENAHQLDKLVQLSLGPLVTHVDLEYYSLKKHGIQALDPLMHLPKLRSLALGDMNKEVVEVLPPTLQELSFANFVEEDASVLARLSLLTRLDCDMEKAAAPSFSSLTGLVNLRSLEVGCFFRPLGVLKTFTMLTSLTFRNNDKEQSGTIFPDLAHLTGLHELVMSTFDYVEHTELLCLSHLTRLTRLDMHECKLAPDVEDSSVLAPLTDLACLDLKCGSYGLSLLPHVRVEELWSLDLDDVTGNISVLQRATGLEHLCFSSRKAEEDGDEDANEDGGADVDGDADDDGDEDGGEDEDEDGDEAGDGDGDGVEDEDVDEDGGEDGVENGDAHGPALMSILPTMSWLYSLDLTLVRKPESQAVFQLGQVLQSLTGLTSLSYSGNFTLGIDLPACAALPDLRVLSLSDISEVTPACITALQAMTDLTYLDLTDTGIRPEHLTPEVKEAFNVERLRRGWPRLKLVCR